MASPVSSAECIGSFPEEFKALTHNAPFPWQESLFSLFLSGTFPPNVSLPTGTGKTSIMALWLLALAKNSRLDAGEGTVPRRLAWVVNRRVVVDQATSEAERLRRRLSDTSIKILDPVRDALQRLSATDSGDLLGISTLRGQFADNAEWRNDPARPAVIIGTVDMIGSRLLFSGYGVGFRAKPLHAGFLGQDALLVHDEAHLEPAFQDLLMAIQKEQERCNEFGKFHVMALSATSRAGGEVFRLTREEEFPPATIPDPPSEPVQVIWRRQKARKAIQLHEQADDKDLAHVIAESALEFKDSRRAVLVFLRKLDDVEKVLKKLPEGQTQRLTGTLRGLERDKLVADNPIFRRFLPKAEPGNSTVYLICTSAGEVGVNISADHLVCDLSTFDSMVQRFGRVNRFGDRNDTEIHILYPAKFEENSDLDRPRERTLELLLKLNGDGSPKALGELNAEDCLAGFAPSPTILSKSDILFDSWSLTTIRGKLPGRPPVEPYLHGLSRHEPPETHLAWREEVGLITEKLREAYEPEDLLEDYPLKPHELLRDRSDRVFKHLAVLAERQPESPCWLFSDDDGNVDVLTLRELARKDRKDRINYKTIVLPPMVGGLRVGLLDGDSDTANDVADEWRDECGNPRRLRVWDDDPQFKEKTKKMRLLSVIDIDPDIDEDETEHDVNRRRYWRWFELPESADNDGSESGSKAVLWSIHTKDVIRNATGIVRRLQLSAEFRDAVILAARFHDLGKRRALFQRTLGNMGSILLAKSGRKKQLHTFRTDYRHEFGSLLDAQSEPEILKLNEDMRQLVLHLIAAHHGRGRPHFPAEEAFDPEPNGKDASVIASQVPQRCARLQRKYGRWGLAYLESLLRAADYAASAKPSATVEGL